MYRALGTAFTVKTPFGNQTIDIPLDQIATSAVNAAWPPLKSKIEAEIPVVVNQAWPLLEKKMEDTVPKLIAQAQPTLQKEEASIMQQVNRTALYLGVAVVGTIALGVVLLRR